VIVSRGYKGSAEGKGGLVSNGKEIVLPASACGDEAYMMARILSDTPVLVGRDRYAAGSMALQKFRPQVILLDDGFQHIRLERDIDLVLLDTEKPFANGKLFPRGTLREQKEALQRASAVVFTRAAKGRPTAIGEVERHAPGKPIFQCVHRSYIAGTLPPNAANGFEAATAAKTSGLDSFKGRRGYIFSGIARNERFQDTIGQAGIHVCGTSFFDDHHWYSEEDLQEVSQSAAKSGAELIITTEKDFIRISKAKTWPLEIVVVGVEIQFPDDGFDQYVRGELTRF
jgi:tetraacyldisaccharide 4'-kinase